MINAYEKEQISYSSVTSLEYADTFTVIERQ